MLSRLSVIPLFFVLLFLVLVNSCARIVFSSWLHVLNVLVWALMCVAILSEFA